MNTPSRKKPDWLKVRFPTGPNYARIDRWHRQEGLHSVCRSAACPNQGECWSRGTATFMVLGNACTRDCRFCNVGHGAPAPPDPDEPAKIAQAVADLGLRHAVITTVSRDDLGDGGAAHLAAVTASIRQALPACRIELLISDLNGDEGSLAVVLAAAPDLLGHNLETVPRLYSAVRQGASWRRSLRLLAAAREIAPAIPTKSGLMLGLGETAAEIDEMLAELRRADVSFLTLGQYLAPSQQHYPVARYIPPEEFAAWRRRAMNMGFRGVEAGPLVRSSYHAEEQFAEAADGS
ncbi:MAG: lipoyl synthase [Desulfuromonadales bacterium]